MFVIRNPRQVPAGTPILTYQPDPEQEPAAVWFEGDEFVKPEGMSLETMNYYAQRGFIEEVEIEDEG